MVFMPPGGAKSTYASVYAPSWAIGVDPSVAIITASHTASLAESFGRRVRNMIRDDMYRDIFPVALDKENHSAKRWGTVSLDPELSATAQYYAAGVGGNITGRRADVGIIDDPFRSKEDADSETIREKAWNWYLADFRTRLRPNASVAIVNTRWHEDDICGRILPAKYDGESGWIQAKDGEWWFVLSIQALCERPDDPLHRKSGESYWPDWYSRQALEQEKKSQTPRNWSALYQQRPSPTDGAYWKRDWFQWYEPDDLPTHVRFYGASDYAVTDDGGDWTVHLVVAVAGAVNEERIYLVDHWREQTESDVWVDEWVRLVKKWKPVEWGEESGQIIKSVGPYLEKESRRHKAFTFRRQIVSASDKAQRAQAARAMASSGRIYLPRQSDWAGDFLERLVKFGASKIDDEHDTLGLIGRMLSEMTGKQSKRGAKPGPKPGTFAHMMKITDDKPDQPSRYRLR